MYRSEFTRATARNLHTYNTHVLLTHAIVLSSVSASTTGIKSVKLRELTAAGQSGSAFHSHRGKKGGNNSFVLISNLRASFRIEIVNV